jgi:hypothetical protein
METLAKTSSRLTILERVWGLNPVFLSRHRQAYDVAMAETRLLQARAYLLAGNSLLAREELHKITKGHLWIHRMAAALSPKLLQNLLRWRKIGLNLARQ